MAESCLNCATPVTENFCGSCGQKKFKRIDKKYLWDELQYTVFHTNKGLLYSIKNILKSPGKTARAFIDGNRVNHYKPILLVFVLSGISTFISFKVLKIMDVMSVYFATQKVNSTALNEMMTSLSSYNSIFMLLLIPAFALTTKIAFNKWGQNYYEHVVMNAYILAFYTLISLLIVYPILFAVRNDQHTFFRVSTFSIFLIPIILIWFFKDFYKDRSLQSIVLRVLGVLGITLVGYFLVIIAVVIAMIIMKGPQGLM